MDPEILIIAGVSVLVIIMVLLPAEVQLLRARRDQHHLPYAKRDYYWGNKLLSHLVSFGIGLFAVYLLKQNPEIFNDLINTLSLK